MLHRRQRSGSSSPRQQKATSSAPSASVVSSREDLSETPQATLAAYANARGIAMTDVRCPVVYISESDARL